MYSHQIAEIVAHEQHKDRQRQAEKLRLRKLIQDRATNRPGKVAGLIGRQMVATGLKLQGHTPASMAQGGVQQVVCNPK